MSQEQNKDSEVIFSWIPFYNEFAHKLLTFQQNRVVLINKIKDIFSEMKNLELPTLERNNNIIDIDPFTVFGLFNKGITSDNRLELLSLIKNNFDLDSEIPKDFSGVPVLNNQKATFYYFLGDRKDNDIDNLWNLFRIAIAYEKDRLPQTAINFNNIFNEVRTQQGIRWNITMGLFWIAPNAYINLDSKNRRALQNASFISDNLKHKLKLFGNNLPDGTNYLNFCQQLHNELAMNKKGINNFPKFSFYADQIANKHNNDDIYNVRDNSTLNFPLNQILYGPPGTGKTYNTIIKAIEITNPELIQRDENGCVTNYDVLKREFDNLKQQGQIEFVTFHQSYSYEEFVEGIKPDLENGKELRYKLQNGIFKTICNNAKELLETKVTYNFNKDNISVYKILIPDESLFAYCIENGCVAINWGNDIDISDCDSQEEIVAKIPEDFESRKQCISQLNLFKLWIDNDLKSGKDVIVVIPGSMNTIKGIAKITGDYFYNSDIENGHQQRKVDWIRKNINISSDSIYNSKFVSPTITGMFNDKINWDTFLNLINNKNNSKSSNAVLIIDEINRGNISKIFGELITLIEEDKRETLSVKLPYSQDDFTVPKNLYIIGTMNTSDRSIASIDIALRRRFKFVEMMPKTEVLVDENKQPLMVEDINLQSLLKTINERISYLLDRDHQIGHSYFMNWDKYDMVTLKDVWFDEIIPLLNEYFYSDWDKLQAILGGKNDNDKNDKKFFITKLKKPDLAYNVDCSDEEFYYNFVKKEDVNETDFRTMLENAKLIEPKSNEINETNEQTEAN